VKEILQKYPEAVKVQDNDRWLPLHYALYREASNEIIEMILEANPEVIMVQDNLTFC
jgi:ankyrin repeat protein